MTVESIERIQQITVQIKRLSSELSILTGMSHNGLKDVTNNPNFIVDIVTDVFQFDPRVKSRKAGFSIARYAATYLLKKYTALTRKEISEYQNGVEHSVVSYRIAEAKKLLDVDHDFRNKVKECMSRIEMMI